MWLHLRFCIRSFCLLSLLEAIFELPNRTLRKIRTIQKRLFYILGHRFQEWIGASKRVVKSAIQKYWELGSLEIKKKASLRSRTENQLVSPMICARRVYGSATGDEQVPQPHWWFWNHQCPNDSITCKITGLYGDWHGTSKSVAKSLSIMGFISCWASLLSRYCLLWAYRLKLLIWMFTSPPWGPIIILCLRTNFWKRNQAWWSQCPGHKDAGFQSLYDRTSLSK